MFEKVSKAALAFFFLQRTHLLGDVEVGSLFWPVVVTNVIGKPIVEFADANSRVARNRGHLRLRLNGATKGEKSKREQISKTHRIVYLFLLMVRPRKRWCLFGSKDKLFLPTSAYFSYLISKILSLEGRACIVVSQYWLLVGDVCSDICSHLRRF